MSSRANPPGLRRGVAQRLAEPWIRFADLEVSSAVVLLMTPALALFYGGMARGKNVLGTIMHSFFLMGLISVQ